MISSGEYRVTLLFCLALALTGCGNLLTSGSMKTDLNAFLDGDAVEEEIEEEAVVLEGVEELEEVEPVEPVEPVIVIEEVVGVEAIEVVEEVEAAEEVIEIVEVEPSIDEAAKLAILELEDLPPPPLERCSVAVDPKFAYRRRLALLAFTIADRRETADFPLLEQQYPEMLKAYINKDRFIVTPATHVRLLAEDDGRNGAWVDPVRQQVMKLANDLGVQFVVAGEILDMSVGKPDVGFFGLMTSFVAGENLLAKEKRNLVVALNIYDGGTGALIKRQTFADDVYVDANSSSHRKSLSKAFFSTYYGKRMTKMFHQQGDFFLSALDCIPMRAKVVAVDDSTVTIDAGIESLILSGDKLQIFRRKYFSWDSSSSGNYRLERYGEITMSGSGPLNSQGVFEYAGMLSGVSPGDIVQAW